MGRDLPPYKLVFSPQIGQMISLQLALFAAGPDKESCLGFVMLIFPRIGYDESERKDISLRVNGAMWQVRDDQLSRS
ncbi:MAG: PepSY-associated TM helix domain-containing protein [Thaumarchaeota archaeon]|nr:PepSY-associated TM helix domain-containing protein [Nitrososphaerota archaeon]